MFFYFQRASFACVPLVYLAAQPAFQSFRYFGRHLQESRQESRRHDPGVDGASRLTALWSAAKPGHVIGIISLVPLSFIVHEPSAIMLVVSDRSRAARRWM